MADDLYSTWLGIAPGARPPDHYTLLGLPRYCAEDALIESAAQKRLQELDRRALHPDPALRDQCQEMMNEVALARVVLKSAKRKEKYDRAMFAADDMPDAQPSVFAPFVSSPVASPPSLPSPPPADAPEPVSTLFSGTSLPAVESAPATPAMEEIPPAKIESKAPSPGSSANPEEFWRDIVERWRAQHRRHLVLAVFLLLGMIGAGIVIREIIIHLTSHSRVIESDAHSDGQSVNVPLPAATAPAAVVTVAPSTRDVPVQIALVPPATQAATITTPKPSIFDDVDPAHAAPPNHAPPPVTPPPPPSLVPAPPVPPPPVKPAPVAPPTTAIARIPAPPADAVAAARQQLAAEAEASPQRLLKEALALSGNSVEARRFALLQMSRERAMAAGLLNAALAAVDEMNKRYQIDALSLKGEALDVISKNTAAPATLQMISKTAMELSNAAADARRYDLAEYLASVALRASRDLNDASAVRQITLRIIEVEKLKS